MKNDLFGPGNSRVAVRLAFLLAFATSMAGAASEVVAEKPNSIANAPAMAPANAVVLPANTNVELEMVDAVSSKTSKHGDMFKLRVALPVKSGDTVLIPAGTPAVGQVVHAEKSHGGGKAGELILAARYIDMPQGQIKLHSSFGAAGRNRTGAALATSIAVGVFGMFVKGKEIEIPAGGPLSARLAEDTTIAPTP